MTRDGRGEIVGGSVLMLKGENSRDVVGGVKADDRRAHAPPPGRRASSTPYYDRAEFINRVLKTVRRT